jgi:iron complex outermembrane receptor protein
VAHATVTVTCTTGDRTTVTDANGTFTLDLGPGTHLILITREGFDRAAQSVTVTPGGTVTFDAALQVTALADTVTVRASNPTVVTNDRTAMRTDTPLLLTPQSVSVITAQQIRIQAPPNLQETLRYTPGVRNEQYGIDNRGDWIAARGSEATTLLNGMRQPITGSWGTVREEPFAFESIAVLRGPASIIAGEAGAGGVVNMISKRPQAEPLREVGVRLGSYDRREVQFDTTGPINQNRTLLYRLVALGRDTGTQIRHADEQRLFVAPSLTWRPGSRGSLTAYGEYQFDESKNTNAFLGLAGTLNPAPNGPIPTDLFIGEPSFDTYGGTRVRLGYEADVALGGAWRLRHSTRYDRVDGRLSTMYAAWWDGFVDATGTPDPNGEHLNRWWYGSDDAGRLATTEVLAEGRVRTGDITHAVLAGVDAMTNEQAMNAFDAFATPLNVYRPVYGTFVEPAMTGGTPDVNRTSRFGLVLQDQMTLAERLHIRLGLRRDRVRNSVVGGDSDLHWVTTGNVGVVYEVADGLAPYVSYAESFVPVAGTTFAGDLFEPRRGEQIEAGLKWESQSVPAQVTAAYYSLVENNRLAADPVNVGYSVQIGRADIRGVELETRTSAGPWTTIGSYTWTHARATADAWGGGLNPDAQLESIPEHQASVWATHDFARFGLAGVTLGGGLRYVGHVGDGTGNVFVPSVVLADLMGSYTMGPWRLSLNVNNLTDRNYIATCLARGDCWFGPRRAVSLTAGFVF